METQNVAGRPAYKKKAGGISVACWENEGKGFGGEPTVFISLSIQRTYKDKQGVFQHATNFRVSDIPKIQVCLDDVYKHYILNEVDMNEGPGSKAAPVTPQTQRPSVQRYGFRTA